MWEELVYGSARRGGGQYRLAAGAGGAGGGAAQLAEQPDQHRAQLPATRQALQHKTNTYINLWTQSEHHWSLPLRWGPVGLLPDPELPINWRVTEAPAVFSQ